MLSLADATFAAAGVPGAAVAARGAVEAAGLKPVLRMGTRSPLAFKNAPRPAEGAVCCPRLYMNSEAGAERVGMQRHLETVPHTCGAGRRRAKVLIVVLVLCGGEQSGPATKPANTFLIGAVLVHSGDVLVPRHGWSCRRAMVVRSSRDESRANNKLSKGTHRTVANPNGKLPIGYSNPNVMNPKPTARVFLE
jgi:hypothetical protein